MIFSATGLVALARVSVVVMRPCSNRLVTRLRRVARRCHGLRPSLDPDFRCRMFLLPQILLLEGPSARRTVPGSSSICRSKDRPYHKGCRAKARRHIKKTLEADGFVADRRRGLAGERRPDDAAVLIELHAQAEAHLHQYIFDLVER